MHRVFSQQVVQLSLYGEGMMFNTMVRKSGAAEKDRWHDDRKGTELRILSVWNVSHRTAQQLSYRLTVTLQRATTAAL
jgi:hypothetical protein